MVIRLIHERSGRAIAEHLEVARTVPERMRGLLGRSRLRPNNGMMIENCSSIHTFFMKFVLDVVFVDSGFAIQKISRGVRPWRFVFAFGAKHVIELPAGTVDRAPMAVGDVLRVEDYG